MEIFLYVFGAKGATKNFCSTVKLCSMLCSIVILRETPNLVRILRVPQPRETRPNIECFGLTLEPPQNRQILKYFNIFWM